MARLIIFGVDGGGTKTEFVMVDGDGNLLARLQTAASNLHRIGVVGVAEQVHHVVRSLVERGRVGNDVTVAVCMSGVDTEQMQADLTHALYRKEPTWIWLVDNDAAAAWWGAFAGSGTGVVTIAGTGSVAYARHGSRAARVGGWGAMLGDEGGGYSLGRAAIIAVLRAHDGLGAPTALQERVLSALGLEQSVQLIDHVHLKMSISDVAALAPTVLAVAAERDLPAQDIVRRAAAALVELAAAAARRVAEGPDCALPAAFVGGLAAATYFQGEIRKELAGVAEIAGWATSKCPPAAGAVYMGAEQLGLLQNWRPTFVDELTDRRA